MGFYVDATFGRGGHAARILEALGREGRLLAIDRDPQAIAGRPRALCRRSAAYARPRAVCRSRDARAGKCARPSVRGMLFDLGVSSPQLDDPQRGFSFRADGPLDMRMDPTRGAPVSDWLAHAGLDEIREVIATLGEERFARRVARRDRGGAPRAAHHAHQPAGRRSSRAPCAPASPASIRRRARSRRCACSSTTSSGSSSAGSPRAVEVLARRRPAGRHQLPFARRPHRQAFMQRESRVDPALAQPARSSRRSASRRLQHRRAQAAARRGRDRRAIPRSRSALLRVAEKLRLRQARAASSARRSS